MVYIPCIVACIVLLVLPAHIVSREHTHKYVKNISRMKGHETPKRKWDGDGTHLRNGPDKIDSFAEIL